MTFTTDRMDVPGATLTYDVFDTERPDAPWLVLVMGLGVQRLHWPDGFCEELAALGLRVVRFDLRDSGESPLAHAPEPWRVGLSAVRDALRGRLLDGLDARALFQKALPYSLDELADDLVALVDHLGAEEAHVVGMSFGGAVAQHAVCRHPTRFRSLVSIASTTGALSVSMPTRRALPVMLAAPAKTREAAETAFLAALRVVGGKGHPTPEDDARRMAAMAFEREKDPSGRLRMLFAMLAAGDRTKALAALKLPTLVLHGADDPLVPPRAGEATAKAIAGARLQVVGGMGHDLPPALWPVLTEAIAKHAHAASPYVPHPANDVRRPSAQESR
ncbi:MAG: alpha/beta fold hydrolase [Sandaracinus sp.]|nr:alpha/beta fold hydrolase [Sandaracinus sp.]